MLGIVSRMRLFDIGMVPALRGTKEVRTRFFRIERHAPVTDDDTESQSFS